MRARKPASTPVAANGRTPPQRPRTTTTKLDSSNLLLRSGSAGRYALRLILIVIVAAAIGVAYWKHTAVQTHKADAPAAAAAGPVTPTVAALDAASPAVAVAVPAPKFETVTWYDHTFTHVPHDPAAIDQLRWGIIFDAGSTGTRLHIYRFRIDNSSSSEGAHQQPVLEDEIFVEVKPGLSAYMPAGVGSTTCNRASVGPQAAAHTLHDLMDICSAVIPSEVHKRTPISLRATAGLRLLGEEAAESVLVAIRKMFSIYNFVHDPQADVAVMRGSEEGVFAWITVNYLEQRLQDHKSAGGDATQLVHAHPKTSAILDLGGASTQIVFEPDFPSWRSLTAEQQAMLYRLPYGSNEYFLFEHSYLGYGLMEARRRTKSALMAHPGLQVHPLLQEDASAAGVELSTQTREGVPVKYHPCLSDTYEEELSIGVGAGDFQAAHRVVVRGHAQGHASCAALTRTLFAKDAHCAHGSLCSFDGHFALPLGGMFLGSDPADAHVYAFSYFYDRTLDVFDLEEERSPRAAADGSGTVLRVGRVRELAEQVCSFSMREHAVRSAAAIEREKETARATLQRALEGSIEERRQAGCKAVRVKQRDGSMRTVLVTPSASVATDSSAVDVASAAAAASPDFPAPSVLDDGACMVEEQPDLSAEAEAKRAHIASPLVDVIASNPHLCLDLTYLHTLLHYAYDLPESVELHVMKRLQRKEIGWCLGAMLSQMAARGW